MRKNMQVVNLTVSRKQYTQITLAIPDVFDVSLLCQSAHEKYIARACDRLDAEFTDEYGEPVEVEQAVAGTEKDLHDYASVPLEEVAPELIALWQEKNAKEAAAALNRMKSATEK